MGTLDERRDDVARAKARVLVAARGDRPRIDGVVTSPPQRPLPAALTLALDHPAAAASIAVAVVCVLGVGGTIALARRAISLTTLLVTARGALRR